MYPSFGEITLFLLQIIKHILISTFLFIKQFTFPWYKDISRKTVFITGAANGVGRELCLRLADEACTLLAVDIDEIGLRKTSELVKERTGQIMKMFICDVRSHEAIRKLNNTISTDIGVIDIIICNAGVLNAASLYDMDDEQYHEVFDVNTHSSFYLIKEFLPDMIKRNSGHFVFVSSIACCVSSAKLAAYCASKAALMSICETLWVELNHVHKVDGVQVMGVTPFHINTNLFMNCKARLQILFKTLDSKYVAEKIVVGIKKNQYHLAIGRLMYFIFILKSILPSKALMELYKFSGGINMMDDYKDVQTVVRTNHYKSIEKDSIKEIF